MSYNIRYDNPADGTNNWHERKQDVVCLLDYYQPGVFGLQEGLVHQLEFIAEELEDYTYIGVGRNDGKAKGEFAAIFYDTARYEWIDGGTFWLSETPDMVSVGWDASMERICTFAKFRDKKGKNVFWVFNAHYDHVGEQSRIMASKLIKSKIANLNVQNDPVIVMGDFNCLPDSQPIAELKNGLTDAGQNIYGPNGTFNAFDPNHKLDQRIDYIFVSGFRVLRYAHVDDRRPGGLWVSDHLPVLLEAEIF